MVRLIILFLVSAAFLCSAGSGYAQMDIAERGYDFILEVSSHSVDHAYSNLEGTSIVGDAPYLCKAEVTFDSIYTEALDGCTGDISFTCQLVVRVDNEGLVYRGRAVLTVAADLDIRQNGSEVALVVRPLPGTAKVKANHSGPLPIESAVCALLPQIVDKLSATVALEELGIIAESRDNQFGIRAGAYDLGYSWVLQVYGMTQSQVFPVPELFRLGSVFTMTLSDAVIQHLVDHELAIHAPVYIDDNGLLVSKGNTLVTSAMVDLRFGAIVIHWFGEGGGGTRVISTWRMCFVSTQEGEILRLQQVALNGVNRPVPEGSEFINPVDELIKTVVLGPKESPLFAGPLGRMRLTYARVTPWQMVLAGRV